MVQAVTKLSSAANMEYTHSEQVRGRVCNKGLLGLTNI